MDLSSQNVVRFLTTLQLNHKNLARIWNLLGQKGVNSKRLFTNLSRGGEAPEALGHISYGIHVTMDKHTSIDMTIRIVWNNEEWKIYTTVTLYIGEDASIIKEFPVKNVNTLDDCLSAMDVAIEDLVSCVDLVTEYRK